MEIEVAQHVRAEKYERGIERTGERNGYRDRSWDTRVRSIELRVPRVRDGGYYPALLEPRRWGERALVAVVQEAYVQRVAPRASTSWSSARHEWHLEDPGQPAMPGAGH